MLYAFPVRRLNGAVRSGIALTAFIAVLLVLSAPAQEPPPELPAAPALPAVASIEFRPEILSPWNPALYPAWVRAAGTEDGVLDASAGCWTASAALPPGKGKCWIDLDRGKLAADIALTVLFDAAEGADVAVQLWDDKGQVVTLDLFMNIVEVATELDTLTFIVPLRKYPTVTRIVVRRMTGDVRVFGVVLTPVATEIDQDVEAMLALARELGDPLSPENPLVREVRAIVNQARTATPPVSVREGRPAVGHTESPPPEQLSRNQPAPPALRSPVAAAGLVAYYDFDERFMPEGVVPDKSGKNVALLVAGTPPASVAGVRGLGALFDTGYFKADTNPLVGAGQFSISLWFKTLGPTENYKLAAAAIWGGGNDASGWNVGTHYSEFWADDKAGSLRGEPRWERNGEFLKGEWNHLVVTYDGAHVRETINGRLVFDGKGTGRKAGAGVPMTVGSWNGGFQYKGVMDELRLYNRVLGHDEIQALYGIRHE
ncbi:MAG: LamG domain-containing protein [Lentisphaerae bacterium]|nr:LamG domain-containing protein [Lentisphaerota bacterium]